MRWAGKVMQVRGEQSTIERQEEGRDGMGETKTLCQLPVALTNTRKLDRE